MIFKKAIKYIELSKEELNLLRPLYHTYCCPQKCHTDEKRIWFIPKRILEVFDNIEYSCCIYCYYNKTKMDLLNNKYKRDELQPILCENLSMNCDECLEINKDHINLLNDNFTISIYKKSPDCKFLKMDNLGNNNFNLFLEKSEDIILIVLHKKFNNEGENNEGVIYANCYLENLNSHLLNNNDMGFFSKSYLSNNEYNITLNNLWNNKLLYNSGILKTSFITSLKTGNKIIIEYGNDLHSINKIKINILLKNNYSVSKKEEYQLKDLLI